MEKIKNLQRPVETTIDGRPVALVTIGHCAVLLQRTTACLKHWERLGLFPPAPYRTSRSRRRLYPLAFAVSLRGIAKQDYYGPRLDRSDWARFHAEIWDAFDAALKPMRHRISGVNHHPSEIDHSDERRQG